MKKIKFLIIAIVLFACNNPKLYKFVDNNEIAEITEMNEQLYDLNSAFYPNKEFTDIYRLYRKLSSKFSDILIQDTINSDFDFNKQITIDEKLAENWQEYINNIDTVYDGRLHNINEIDKFIKSEKLKAKTYNYTYLYDKCLDLEQNFSHISYFYNDSILGFGQKKYFVKTAIISESKWTENTDSILVELNAYLVSPNTFKEKIIIIETDTFYTKKDIFNIEIPVKNEIGNHIIKGKLLGLKKLSSDTIEFEFSTNYEVVK